MKKKKLVYGVGINDVDYAVQPMINGKQVICKFYRAWRDMLMRCYSEKCQAVAPTYIGCTVCNEWLTFSNFKAWMEKQNWKDKELDKDLLFVGNKVYSPNTCVFVDAVINSFTTERGAARGEWPLGVYFHKQSGKFKAQCGNPFTKNREYLGCFTCPNEAHEVWKNRKHQLALQLADLQSDERVADALRQRYASNRG